MNSFRLIVPVAAVAFISGFWTACTVGFDPSEHDFSCTENSDCISPNVCRNGICQAEGASTCVDNDDDGFGTGEDTTQCRACLENGICDADCNDNDASVAPNLKETCDGKDNDCDGEVDEPIACESSADCPLESPYIPSCEGQVCVYKVPIQTGPCAGDNAIVACVGGMREEKPDECF